MKPDHITREIADAILSVIDIIQNHVVSPDIITDVDDRYDLGRLDERLRIRNAMVQLTIGLTKRIIGGRP